MKIIRVENISYVVSDLTTEQVALLEKEGQNVIKDEKGNAVYGISTGGSRLTEKMAGFNHTMSNGKAAIELVFVQDEETETNSEQEFVDSFTMPLINMESHEAEFKSRVEAIVAAKEGIRSRIQTVQVIEAAPEN